MNSDLVDALDREGQVFHLLELLKSNPTCQQMNEPHVGVNLWNAAGIVSLGPEGRPLVAGCESLAPALHQSDPSFNVV